MNGTRSVAVYRRLSALYPKRFHAEYGADLVAAFSAQLADEGVARTWWSTARDLVVTIPSQHLETRMNRPTPHTVAVVATTVTVAAFAVAVVTGTGPAVGVFLLIALVGLVVATLALHAARSVEQQSARVATRWRTLLIAGVALLAAVIVVINVPPYNDRELPDFGWALMMLSLVTSIGLMTVGLTMGIARRVTRHTATS